MDIQLYNINKSFDDKQVLKDVNIRFTEGTINCIMGASGTGKTTLLNILLGLITPDSGRISGLEGRKVSAVFQEDRLAEHWDALKNVLLVCDKTVGKAEVIKHFNEVGLTDYENKPVRALSGGMKRRVAIVRALITDCDLIIMDEPFKELDEELKQQVMEYVLNKTKGKTVIMVTHDMDEVTKLNAELIKFR